MKEVFTNERVVQQDDMVVTLDVVKGKGMRDSGTDHDSCDDASSGFGAAGLLAGTVSGTFAGTDTGTTPSPANLR